MDATDEGILLDLNATTLLDLNAPTLDLNATTLLDLNATTLLDHNATTLLNLDATTLDLNATTLLDLNTTTLLDLNATTLLDLNVTTLDLNATTLLDLNATTQWYLNTTTLDLNTTISHDLNATTQLYLNATTSLDFSSTSGAPGTSGNVSWHSFCSTSEPHIMRENFPYPNLDDAMHLDVYEVLQMVLMGLMLTVSVGGNLAVMVVVYLNTFLHTTINYYLVNLAVADLLITVFCWPTLVNRLTHPLYLLGRPLCKISVLTQGTCVTVSVLTLATVACDRVYAVLLPLKARSASSRPLTIIILLWLFSFAVAFPSFYVRDTRVFQWNDLREESCADILCTDAHRHIFTYYRILLLAMLFFVPGGVMVFAYSLIVFRLWCVRRGPFDPHSQAACPEPHTRAKRKIVKMTAMVLLAFTACWLPLHGLIMYDLMVDHPMPSWFDDQALFWAYCLGYCNSALNPLLYGGFSDNFRLGFRKILGRCRRASDQHHDRSAGTASTFLSRIPISSRTSNPISHQTSYSSHASSGSANTPRHISSTVSSRETSKRKQIASQNPDALSGQPLVETNEPREGVNPSEMVISEVSWKSKLDSGIQGDDKIFDDQSHEESGRAQMNTVLKEVGEV